MEKWFICSLEEFRGNEKELIYLSHLMQSSHFLL